MALFVSLVFFIAVVLLVPVVFFFVVWTVASLIYPYLAILSYNITLNMGDKRSFARIWYRIVIDYFPSSPLGFQDECTGFFVSSFGVKIIQRYAHNVYPLLPHWCIKVRYEFDYDNSAPISELEYSKRVRGWEDLRALLTKDIIQITVINLFTNPHHLCLTK